MKHDGQRRKYTNEPYVTHLIAVASRVDAADGDLDMVKAALCHDVLEDTEASYDEVEAAIGPIAANYVLLLTDSGREKGNRAARKAMDRARLAAAPPPVQTIKLADLLDNTHSIVERDPDFAKVYIAEKRALLEVLSYGDKRMLKEALHVVALAESQLGITA
jgi:(p)ppGpp synthase/HD superfamily hydrolase